MAVFSIGCNESPQIFDIDRSTIVTASHLGALPIPIPPFPEQAAIAAYLNDQTERIAALISQVETAIERLQEFRSALVTAAVTGRLTCVIMSLRRLELVHD